MQLRCIRLLHYFDIKEKRSEMREVQPKRRRTQCAFCSTLEVVNTDSIPGCFVLRVTASLRVLCVILQSHSSVGTKLL